MVVAVTSHELIRRTFEDRMVALLGQRGTKGIPAYAAVGSRGQVEEADLRQAIARSGAEGVLMTRVTRIDRSSGDRKSTRLNSSHLGSSYAVFCLKQKNYTPPVN